MDKVEDQLTALKLDLESGSNRESEISERSSKNFMKKLEEGLREGTQKKRKKFELKNSWETAGFKVPRNSIDLSCDSSDLEHIEYDSETGEELPQNSDNFEQDEFFYTNRIRYLVRNKNCFHKNTTEKCACMCGMKFDGNKYYYDSDMLDDLVAITFELRLREIAMRIGVDPKVRYKTHHAVVVALTTKDKHLVCDPRFERSKFLSYLYEIREFYGLCRDFGERARRDEVQFEAQSISTVFSQVLDMIKNFTVSGAKTIAEIIGSVLKKLFATLHSLFGLLSETMSTILEKLMDKIRDCVIQAFNPLKFIKESIRDSKLTTLVGVVCIVMVLVFIDVLGILTYKLATTMVDRMIAYFSDQFVAQGPNVDMVGGVVTLIVLVLGLSRTDFESLSKKARQFTSLVTAGFAASSLLASVFLILPVVLQSALKHKFGSQEDKDLEVVEDWLQRANAVIRLRKVSKVLTSLDYLKWLSDLVKESKGLKLKIKSPVVANIFVRNLVSITEILQILVKFHEGNSSRDLPFCLHFAALPGIGKTLISDAFCRELFGVMSHEIYNVPVSSDHWDGFLGEGHKVIILDEFLVGSPEQRLKFGTQYLELVSTKAFSPPLPSVDDPTVGIKGTRAEPIGVLSINNAPYSVVPGIPDDALFRRRNYVIRITVKSEYRHIFNGSTMDLTKLKPDELKSLAWMSFSLMPDQPNCGMTMEDLSYSELLTILKPAYKRHQDLCEALRDSLRNDVPLEKPPSQLLEETLRELRGIPNEPLSITDALMQIFCDAKNFVWTAQGPESKEQRMDEGAFDKTIAYVNKQIRKIRKDTAVEKVKLVVERCDGKLDQLLENFDDDNSLHKIKLMRSRLNRLRERIGEPTPSTSQTEEECQSDVEFLSIPSDGESSEFSIQKDIISFVDHSNVDPRLLHRHRCLGTWTEPMKSYNGIEFPHESDIFREKFICQRNFAHKHEPTVHSFLCPTCVKAGRKEDWNLLHGGSLIGGNSQNIPGLLPYDIDIDYEGESEEFKKKMHDFWFKVVIDKFLSTGKTPIIIPVPDDEADGLPHIDCGSGFSMIRATAKTVSLWVSLFVLIYSIRRLFNRDEAKNDVETLCFAQSPSYDRQKETRVKARRGHNYTAAKAQSGDKQFYLKINGDRYLATPVSGQIVMTYYHSFVHNGTLIEDGTPIEAHYGGKRHVFAFNSSFLNADVEHDIAFLAISCKQMQQFPNIAKQFWTDNDVETFLSTSGCIIVDSIPRYVTVVKAKNKNYSYDTTKVEMDECLMYKYPTVKGDCGSIIRSFGQICPNKIMGMHVAGGSSKGDSFGLAVIVTREDIERAIASFSNGELDIPDDLVMSAQRPENVFYGPNLIRVEKIPKNQVVYQTRKSKLKQSIISEDISVPPKKCLPLLSAFDDRLPDDSIDPLVNMVNDTLSIEHELLSNENKIILEEISEQAYQDWNSSLKWPIGKRQLTFEEAVGGVPGLLCSMKVLTSPGYPLCKVSRQRGKKDYFWFDKDGNLEYNPEFKRQVLIAYENMEKGIIDDERFIAFLKDEVVSQQKIDERRCRIIYCGNLIVNVAFRMMFGSFIIAFNTSYEETCSSVGMNQYSHDMHIIYDQLREVGNSYVAGDYKNFDKRSHPDVFTEAYGIVAKLTEEFTTPQFLEAFIRQQRTSPIQVLDWLVYLKQSQFSGLFFTTIVGTIAADLYIRFVFAKQCPTKIFKEHVRAKVLIDDHVWCFSDECKDQMTPFKIRECLKTLGQVYTSDVKNEELKDEFRTFEEITFLGAHPVLINGKYCGAMKKDTLFETLHWTRNNNLTTVQECKMAMELSSIWGYEFYDSFCKMVNNALFINGYDEIEMPCHKQMIRVVSSRTAASGVDFPYGFVAQGPEKSIVQTGYDLSVDGKPINTANKSLIDKSMNESHADLAYGTESKVLRATFKWKSTDIVGKSIWKVDVPFGILSLGSSSDKTLQNMPFDFFQFWEGDVELIFLVNGTIQQSGLLAAYFNPLADYETELPNIFTLSNVLMQPDKSAEYSLMVPFKYLRSVLNTQARTTESLGTLFVTPISLLRSGTGQNANEVNITVLSRFPNSTFRIPRPLTSSRVRRERYINAYGSDDIPEIVSFDGPFEAQGSSQSSNVSNIYNVGGNMPVQDLNVGVSGSAQQEITAEASIPMPLDNPPLCSGAVPVEQAFPGMATSHGVRPTTDLQLYPAALSRQQMEIFDPAETKIESILGKNCLLTTLKVDSSQLASTELLNIMLNTRMGLAEGNGIPINLIALNKFMFWRADIEISLIAVITKFHSLSVQLVVAYGASDVQAGDRNINLSKIMSFNPTEDTGAKYTDSLVIPYNAQTEFLRTYEGEKVTDPTQNYSLGRMAIYLQNKLIAPETVSQEINLLVFVKFLEPKVAVPRPNSPFTWNGYLEYDYTQVWTMKIGGNGSTDQFTIVDDTIGINSSVFIFPDGKPPSGVYYQRGNSQIGGQFSSGDQGSGFYTNAVKIEIGEDVIFTVTPEVVQPEWTRWKTLDFTVPLWNLTDVDTQAKDVAFHAQGPDVSETSDNKMAVEFENDPGTHLTDENSMTRVNEVCKIEIGKKFEFCISDLHEICRRYIKIKPVNNESLDQFNVMSLVSTPQVNVNCLNIGVQPQNEWRALYAGWAGSVKYRIFVEHGNLPQVTFVPYYNSDITTPGIPIIDAVEGNTFVYNDALLYSDSAITGPLAREVLYPISDQRYIDISCPFQSHYNFCYNSTTQSIAPVSSGTLTLITQGEISYEIFTAFGDDLRLGIFRPPKTTTFNMTVFKDGIAGFYN